MAPCDGVIIRHSVSAEVIQTRATKCISHIHKYMYHKSKYSSLVQHTTQHDHIEYLSILIYFGSITPLNNLIFLLTLWRTMHFNLTNAITYWNSSRQMERTMALIFFSFNAPYNDSSGSSRCIGELLVRLRATRLCYSWSSVYTRIEQLNALYLELE